MDMEKRELTCIRCPLGCAITVTLEGSTIQEITGFTCKRGEDYARQEVLDPTRTVTSVVFIDSESERMLPVKTKEDIPKDKIFEIMEALKSVRVKAPVKIGQVILENAAGTGVPVVATKDVIL
mgnify:CR=1 FL=1